MLLSTERATQAEDRASAKAARQEEAWRGPELARQPPLVLRGGEARSTLWIHVHSLQCGQEHRYVIAFLTCST